MTIDASALAELESELLALLHGEHVSMSLSFNEISAPGNQTVGEYLADAIQDNDEPNWISPEERERAIANNSWWMLQHFSSSEFDGVRMYSASSLPAIFNHIRNRAGQ